MSQVQRDHEQRIIDGLEEIEDQLEQMAATDTAFGERAGAALDWLDEHAEEGDDGE